LELATRSTRWPRCPASDSAQPILPPSAYKQDGPMVFLFSCGLHSIGTLPWDINILAFVQTSWVTVTWIRSWPSLGSPRTLPAGSPVDPLLPLRLSEAPHPSRSVPSSLAAFPRFPLVGPVGPLWGPMGPSGSPSPPTGSPGSGFSRFLTCCRLARLQHYIRSCNRIHAQAWMSGTCEPLEPRFPVMHGGTRVLVSWNR
jgi:hypothetical protein